MGIAWSPGDSPHKVPVMRSINICPVDSPNKLLNKEWSYRWFETPWRLWDLIETVLRKSIPRDSPFLAIAFKLYL